MTPADLVRILDQLEQLGPQRRQSGKRAKLAGVRERLLALHARGHSWRAIARALSAAGESVTPDLLRAVCNVKPKRRRTSTETRRDATAPAPRRAAIAAKPGDVPSPGTPTATFGAKGLQL